MVGPADIQFQHVEIDWNSRSDALRSAEARLAEALKHFRHTGNNDLLRQALVARQIANDDLRHLMRQIWSNPI